MDVLQSEVLLRPMQAADLDAVARIEASVHSHPWTLGNFNDSLQSQHKAWVMTQQDEVIAYALMMLVLDEAELLNISVALPHQKQGLGSHLLTHMIDEIKK